MRDSHDQPARTLCKRCGAESVPGIGYAADTPGPLQAPAPGCPNPHAVTRVIVSTLTVSLFGTYVDGAGAECIGGGRLARVRLDRSPDLVTHVAHRQVTVR